MNRFAIKYFNVFIAGILCLSCFLFFTGKITAQNPVIEDIIEQLSANSTSEDEDYASIVDDLSFYLENPLNLNDANIESLEKLHFLNEFQIENLLNYIGSKGPMKTIYELQLIKDFDFETIGKMQPFVRVSDPMDEEKPHFTDIIKNGNHKLIAETKFFIQDQKGYLPNNVIDSTVNPGSHYPGNKMKDLFKYRFNYKTKFFAGFTAEKDPGETMNFDNRKYGFDFYSFHLQANNIGKFRTIVLGDYQVSFGQGLILGSGFGLGKSTDAINIRKKSQGLRYYSSTDENNFMRGIASSIRFGKIELTALISHKKIDASLTETDTIQAVEERIKSFQNTGYHRTESEMQNRKTITESILGSRIGIRLDNFRGGLNFLAYHYNIAPVQSGKPYKLFEFTGETNLNISADYNYFAKKFTFFGEVAMSKNNSFAVLNGLITKIVDQLSFSVLQRYYQKNYQANYGSAFSENSKVNNEQGLYYGLVYHPFRMVKISAFADAFQSSWLKYGVDAPSQGNEYFVQADYVLNRNISMYLRWRNETKMGNLTSDINSLNLVVNENKQNFRYHISYNISKQIELRNRLEFSRFNKNNNNEYGFMILQDIHLDFQRIPISLDFRYCYFDATFETRIYAYENDLLYDFSIPAYSGKGSRFYVLCKYKLANKLDFRIRYSQFLYVDQQTIGTGLDEIEGNIKSEFKFQIVVHL